MRESPYPLEQSVGLCFYATDSPGTGGRLKKTPEDFLVEELPAVTGSEGPYLICRLTKRDWDTPRVIRELAKRLGVSHRRFGWAGTKDKNAVTRQLISVYGIAPEQVAAISLRDVQIEVIGHSPSALALGDLAGNRFRITIRDILPGDTGPVIREVHDAATQGLPNYFGIQRFGVIRPITHLVGRRILRGELEEAVLVYIGDAFPGEAEAARTARDTFRQDRDPRTALALLPTAMSYERAMLHHLVEHPGDYPGALKALPPKLLSMFVSAYQSFLFNMALSERIADGRPVSEPMPGDRLLFANGREDRVTAANQRLAATQVSRGRCKVAIWMPGSPGRGGIPGPDDDAIAAILQADGITPGQFRAASDFVRSRFDGALRSTTLETVVDAVAGEEDGSLSLAFELGPGQYATTVCREYMKADPMAMI